MIKISPSILAADRLNMERDITRVVEAGCDWLHIDIMDAHFVPNLSYGPDIVKAINQRFDTLLDVHLMMDNPTAYLPVFIKNGADIVTIHAEISEDIGAALDLIHSLGCKTGLSVKPGTPVSALVPYLDKCDMVLIMTVEPGFGGQSFMTEQVAKIAELRAMGYQGLIEADGGVSCANIQMLADAGLTVAVMGTAAFKSRNMEEDFRMIHSL